MTLFGQKTDTSKVDSIVNNHLRRLLETPVAPKLAAPAQEAVFTSDEEPSIPSPAGSSTAVAYVDQSLVVTAEEPVSEPMPEVVAEAVTESTDVARVAVYIVEEPAAFAPAPEVIAEPVNEPAAPVCFEQSEPEAVEPVFTPVVEPVAEPIVAPVAMPTAVVETVVESKVENSPEALPAVSDVAASLANDLARCLAGAFQNLQHHISAENQKFNVTLQQQIQRLQDSVDSVANLSQPVAELASAVAEQRSANAAQIERFEQLGSTVATLEQSQNRNNTELVTLRIEQMEMRATVSTHADELASLKGAATETERRVAGMSDVLDRQNNVLRHLHALETKRAAALERAFESLNRSELQPRLAIPA